MNRRLADNRTLVFEMSEGRLIHAMGINAQRDLAVVRRLIERQIPIDPAALADPSQSVNAILKR